MLCDICHAREAKIMYTEIINGQKREQHLCENCASEQTLAIKDPLGNEIPIGSILSGILQNYAKGIASKTSNEPVCMRCGMTASDLVKGGRLGCPECYNVFSMILDKNLKTEQGSVEHHGKIPTNAKKTEVQPAAVGIRTAADIMKEATDEIARRNAQSTDNAETADEAQRSTISNDAGKKIDSLKKLLQEALAVEDYDEAARLRDEIHAIEKDESVVFSNPQKADAPKRRSRKGGTGDER